MSEGITHTDKQLAVIHELPGTTREVGDALGISPDAVRRRIERVNESYDGPEEHPIYMDSDGVRVWDGPDIAELATPPETDDSPTLPDLSETPLGENPSETDLNERERYILSQLPTGVSVDALAEDIGEREAVVSQYLRSLREDGWKVYVDETAELVTIEGDHTLRSSEHKGTRTRKANRWWERRHNDLVREFKSLETPTAPQTADPSNEDWVLHVTDIHSGDHVRTADGTNVYTKHTVAEAVRYITEKSLELAAYHNADYDTAHILWGGDFVTGEGVYEGMFEDLDAWLDEQHDILLDPLLEQLKAHSERFETVNVVTQIGNHGSNRASGTSKQANADLILYKSIRNTVAALRKHTGDDLLSNVNFRIGEARPYINFPMRDGTLKGHLRHGQNRSPQAQTSARHDKWITTLHHHDFSAAFNGHHHVSGRVPWDGPPIFFSGTSKPPSDFVERIAASASMDPREHIREIATCCAFANHGLTGSYPVKTHDFDYVEASRAEL
jgi:hypothetical protein